MQGPARAACAATALRCFRSMHVDSCRAPNAARAWIAVATTRSLNASVDVTRSSFLTYRVRDPRAGPGRASTSGGVTQFDDRQDP